MYNNVDTYMSLVPYMLYSTCIHVYTCTVHCMSNSHISCVSVCVCVCVGGGGGGGGEGSHGGHISFIECVLCNRMFLHDMQTVQCRMLKRSLVPFKSSTNCQHSC